MLRNSILVLGFMGMSLWITACVPVAIGAAGAIAVDQAAEQDGDDGLF